MNKEGLNLNENDRKLLSFCRREARGVNEIAELLKIKPSNVSARIEKLEQANLITVQRGGKGKRTLIKTKPQKSDEEYILQILQELKNNGGEMPIEKYATTPDLFMGCVDYLEKSRANYYLLYGSDLVENKIILTKKGEKFLKEKSK